MDVYRKLEISYDCNIQPQQRSHIKTVLELVIRRIIELRNEMVKWNPPNSYMRLIKKETNREQFFPWEIVHFDEILVDLKLSPDSLELPIPKFIREDYARQHQERDNLVSAYMKVKHETDDIYILDKYEPSQAPVPDMSIEEAMAIIRRNERGRQACDVVNKLRLKRMFLDNTEDDIDADEYLLDDTEDAAISIQRMIRGILGKKSAQAERTNELMFLGMEKKIDSTEVLKDELNKTYIKRKQEQLENKESYEQSLMALKQTVSESEGTVYKDKLVSERNQWMTAEIMKGKVPSAMDDFYKMLESNAESKNGGTELSATAKGSETKKDKKDSKGADSKKDAKKPDKKDAKAVAAVVVDADDPAMPKLQKKSELTEKMVKMVEEYGDVWESKLHEVNKSESKYDETLAKDIVRPGVYDELRKQVDDLLVLTLAKIQTQLDNGKKKKKAKKKKKKKAKKGKGKKKKPLPGEKISELKGMDAVEMLSRLIENKLVVNCRKRTIDTLIGDFNYLGSLYHDSDRQEQGAWEPEDPSFNQLRKMLTEYCILPNASPEIKAAIPANEMIKTVMLYGPPGTGKTLAVEIIAYELGALLIHLTPDKLKGLFSGKSGPTKLVHMVMTVACDNAMQPVVVYIDECEKFFTGGKKNKDKDGPSRFKKDFQTYKKLAMTPEFRCIIIGTTNLPENAEIKDLKSFFDKMIYMPYPDYSSRNLIWKYYLESQMRPGLFPEESDPNRAKFANLTSAQSAALELKKRESIAKSLSGIDISSLAKVSEGYSAGSIARAAKSVLTMRRVKLLRSRPVNCFDFIDSLSLQVVTYQDDRIMFTKFIQSVTGLDSRRKQIDQAAKAAINGDKGGADKKDKKDKDPKKK